VHEELLAGGNTHAEIVKIGDTVRRPTGHWTPGVHAVLHHLEARGYGNAPRVLGVDDRGREVLTYVAGTVVWPEHFSLVQTDSALADVAACIRSYHDAVADFDPADAFTWSDHGSDPRGPAEILCHNDLAPWNLVHGDDGVWTFIDWDLAAPGRRSWDMSLALLSFVSLMPDSGLTDAETIRRIAIFHESYGTDLFPDDALSVAVERCGHEAERIGRLGALGEQPYARLLAEGHYEIWQAAAEHIRALAPRWQVGISG
jgi:Phosphotransferase enzyme family